MSTKRKDTTAKTSTNDALEQPIETRMLIARRAYELYLGRHGEHGHDFDDRVQAEREILGSAGKEDEQ